MEYEVWKSSTSNKSYQKVACHASHVTSHHHIESLLCLAIRVHPSHHIRSWTLAACRICTITFVGSMLCWSSHTQHITYMLMHTEEYIVKVAVRALPGVVAVRLSSESRATSGRQIAVGSHSVQTDGVHWLALFKTISIRCLFFVWFIFLFLCCFCTFLYVFFFSKVFVAARTFNILVCSVVSVSQSHCGNVYLFISMGFCLEVLNN